MCRELCCVGYYLWMMRRKKVKTRMRAGGLTNTQPLRPNIQHAVHTPQGTLYFIDVVRATSLRASGLTNIDQEPIVSISPSHYLQHFVVGTSAGLVRIFSYDRVCVQTLQLGLPILAVSFLNDHGDLLVATEAKLVRF